MNIKTQETNQQVIDRMENGYVNNIENVESGVNTSVIDPEMRKVILKKGKQIFNRKTVDTKSFITYVDSVANSLIALQSV